MLVNAAFSFAEFAFEVPTGVVADTLGRRVSLLFCLITLLGATLAYVALPALGPRLLVVRARVDRARAGVHVLERRRRGLAGRRAQARRLRPADRGVFAKSQIVFGVAMLIGTTAGGLLGQLDLRVPYVVRRCCWCR